MFSVEGNKVFPVARITENEILERQIEQLQATFFYRTREQELSV